MNHKKPLVSIITEADNKIRLRSGSEDRRIIEKNHNFQPPHQGKFRVNERTEIYIPASIKPEELESWKERMLLKYNGYDLRESIKRLTGAAKDSIIREVV